MRDFISPSSIARPSPPNCPRARNLLVLLDSPLYIAEIVRVESKTPMPLPKITIVTPSFNQGQYLE